MSPFLCGRWHHRCMTSCVLKRRVMMSQAAVIVNVWEEEEESGRQTEKKKKKLYQKIHFIEIRSEIMNIFPFYSLQNTTSRTDWETFHPLTLSWRLVCHHNNIYIYIYISNIQTFKYRFEFWRGCWKRRHIETRSATHTNPNGKHFNFTLHLS